MTQLRTLLITAFFIAAMSNPGSAQLGFLHNDSIVVLKSGDTLFNAWSGGLNYPQFSDFDFDFDGDQDLFVFDRSQDNIRVFLQETINGTTRYLHKYDVASSFPSDVRYRAALVDYDADGRKDLFCYGIGGMKVYRNVGDASNGLQWEVAKPLLYSQYPNGYSNLNISSADIPAIVDLDFDGDIDILTFAQGGNHVEYHQNQSMELYGVPDSLEFIVKNECWGLFSEDVNTNDILLNDPNYPCTGGNIPNPESAVLPVKSATRHSGSTLLALDYDNSGVMDLLIGDASFTNINLLLNGGTAVNTNSAMASVESNFPANTTPVDIQIFPATYYLDVDFDGIKDLLVAPNAKNVSLNEKSVFFYKNLGQNNDPTFVFLDDDFLQNQMIEHGTGSVPVLFDYNEDGLEDLLVANFYRYKPILDKESVVAYYQNTGTTSQPEFTFVDDDIFNLASENYGLRSIPAFGDIDGDGDKDMYLGLENGTLAYYQNQSSGSGAVFSSGVLNVTDNNGTVISSNGFAFPQLFDLNKDGLLDLVLGKRSGEIAYYKNIGTTNSPSFQLVNGALSGIDVSPSAPDGYAAPHFFLQEDTIRLFAGSVDGKLLYYSDIENNLDSTDLFTLESPDFLGIDVQGYSSYWVQDLDQDGRLNMFVGQDLGGLFHYEVDPESNVGLHEIDPSVPLVALYPNPATSELVIATTEFSGASYQLTDVNGKALSSGVLTGEKTELDIAGFERGFYVVRLQFPNGTSASRKVLKW